MNTVSIGIPILVVVILVVVGIIFWYKYKHDKSHPNKHDVEEYIDEKFPNLQQKYGEKCLYCLKDAIVSTWSNKEYSDFKDAGKEKQQKYLEALLYFNCNECAKSPEPPKLDGGVVLKWLTVHLPGASADCYRCMTEFIVKNWTMDDFQKLEGYSAEKQAEALQAIIGFSCDACQTHEKPEKLIKDDVEKYLEGILGDKIPDDTMKCLLDYAMKALDLATFNQYKEEIKNDKGDLTNISDNQKKFLEMLSQKCGGQ